MQAAWPRFSASPRHFRVVPVPKRGGGRFGVQAEVRQESRVCFNAYFPSSIHCFAVARPLQINIHETACLGVTATGHSL
jgi:hypothetical protein